MFRVALASVLGNKMRLAMTALAVVLGVAFVSGTFMLTDSMDRAFSNLFSDVYAGTDVYVTPGVPGRRGCHAGAPRPGAVPGRQRAGGGPGGRRCRGGDGVRGGLCPGRRPRWRARRRDGTTDQRLFVAGPGRGTLHPGGGAPRGGAGRGDPGRSDGRIDRYEVGDTLPVLLESGRQEFELVGITGFGEQDNLGGSTAVTFTPDRAQELFDKVGEYDEIAVEAAEGVTPPELVERVEAAIDTEMAEVSTGTEQAEQAAAEIQEGLSFLTTGLLAFAAVALFVAVFLITNTFSIIVAQRTREFALLRAVGASSRQVLWTVVVEALVVTTVAAVAPARRASRISPMEAMRQGATADADRVGTRRTVAGALLAVVGSAALVLGLAVELSQPLPVVGAGAAAMFVGIALLAPHLAGPVAAVVGWLPARLGVAGRLSRNNAAGNANARPRRPRP